MMSMRCAIYARYSSDLQNDRSIEDQVRNCRDFASRSKWTILEEQVYADRAVSGFTTVGRMALQELLQAAKSRPKVFDYVLIDDTSRLSRDQIDQQELVRELVYNGVYVYFVSQGIDSRNEQAIDILLPVHGIKDSVFRRDLAQKTKRGMAGQVLRGFNPGGRTYGFCYTKVFDAEGTIDKKTGQVKVIGTKVGIDPDKRPIIAQIFERFALGWSYRELCRDLNDREVDPPGSENQRRTLKSRPSWCPNALRFILLNPKYIGDWTWNKNRYLTDHRTGKRRHEVRPREEWVEKTFPELRIVSDETWRHVQARFESNKRPGYRRGGPHSEYLLSGLMRCQVCGGRYVLVGGGAKDDPFYGCSINWNRGKSVCANSARVRKSELETRILTDLKRRLFQPDALRQIVDDTNAKIKARMPHRPGMISELEAKRDRVRKAIANLIDAIETSALSGELAERLTVRESELKSVEQQIASLRTLSQAPAIRIDEDYAVKWILALDQILSKNGNAGRAEFRSCLKVIEMRPVEIEGKKFLEAMTFPNFRNVFAVVGFSSKENGGGGRI